MLFWIEAANVYMDFFSPNDYFYPLSKVEVIYDDADSLCIIIFAKCYI